MQDYKKLNIWTRSKSLAKDIYNYTNKFPKKEIYGLTSQMRRSAVSIPANIAEGAGRKTNKDFANFINIALGSTNELQTFIEISLDLDFIQESEATVLIKEIEEIKAMILSFLEKLRT